MTTRIESVADLEFTPPGRVFPSPVDWRDQVIYFLLVDRFDDNQAATPPYDPATAVRGREEGQGGIFQGGKLAGVTRRLDYPKNLGCTAVGWGAFDTTGVHFFNDQHPIYQGIAAVARVRAQEPSLRYGRQYFREISGNGVDFGFPLGGRCALAFSRILDREEVLVALNLEASPRQDCITVDRNLTPPGSLMTDLLKDAAPLTVQDASGRAYVRVPLQAHQGAILKRL